MPVLQKLSSIILFGNPLTQYAMALWFFVFSLVILYLFRTIIIARIRQIASKTTTQIDDALIDLCAKVKPSFYIAISACIAIRFIYIPEHINKWIIIIIGIVVLYSIIQAISHFLDFLLKKHIQPDDDEDTNEAHNESILRIAKMGIMLTIWLIVILLILANIGVDVTSVIASLGIGGIAIALAVQNILSDVFSSISIFLDKPFQVGDYIIVGQDKGTVERIGLKTTRLRTLRGEELIVSNKELTTARVQNFKKLENRRESFEIHVVYGLTQATLKSIPKIIKTVIDKQKDVRFDRCHFTRFGQSSLIFEIVYHVDSANYELYMNRRQAINLGIYTQFAKEGIEFAYPSQTLFVEKI